MEVKTLEYKILSKGRKWFKAETTCSKNRKAQILINDVSESWELDSTQEFTGEFVLDRTRWASKVSVTPLNAETAQKALNSQKEVKRINEIERWLGYVEEKAPQGYLYGKGIRELSALGIADFSEYQKRLDSAKDLANKKLINKNMWS